MDYVTILSLLTAVGTLAIFLYLGWKLVKLMNRDEEADKREK